MCTGNEGCKGVQGSKMCRKPASWYVRGWYRNGEIARVPFPAREIWAWGLGNREHSPPISKYRWPCVPDSGALEHRSLHSSAPSVPSLANEQVQQLFQAVKLTLDRQNFFQVNIIFQFQHLKLVVKLIEAEHQTHYQHVCI